MRYLGKTIRRRIVFPFLGSLWLLNTQFVASYVAIEGEEYFEVVFVRGEAVSYGDAAFVLDIGINIASGEDGRVVPEVDQTVHGGTVRLGSR